MSVITGAVSIPVALKNKLCLPLIEICLTKNEIHLQILSVTQHSPGKAKDLRCRMVFHRKTSRFRIRISNWTGMLLFIIAFRNVTFGMNE